MVLLHFEGGLTIKLKITNNDSSYGRERVNVVCLS